MARTKKDASNGNANSVGNLAFEAKLWAVADALRIKQVRLPARQAGESHADGAGAGGGSVAGLGGGVAISLRIAWGVNGSRGLSPN